MTDKHYFRGTFPIDSCKDCGKSQYSAFHYDMLPKGSPKFHALLKEIGDLHDIKQRDYGLANDPFHNVRASEELGIPGFKGAILRANDKMVRLKKFCRDGVLSNESARDSMLDGAVYLLIAAVLFDEQTNH